MRYILWFFQLRFLILKNSLWRDTKTMIRTLSVAAAVIAVQYVLIRLFQRYIFGELSEAQAGASASLFFFLAVAWISILSFVQSISSFVRSFFNSADMHYLITLPIPSDHIFLLKFSDHVASTLKSTIFLFFPFLAAAGITINASGIYYAAMIPLFVLISIIPCTVGVAVSMAGVRIVSAKCFGIITSILAFAANIIFAVLFSNIGDKSADYIVRLAEFMQRPLIPDAIPLTAGIRLFHAAAFGGRAYGAAIFLLAGSALFVAGAFFLSKKLFFEGWAKNQGFAQKPVSKRNLAEPRQTALAGSAVLMWIKTEWKMAFRNQEMLMGGVFMLLFFIAAAVFLITSEYFANKPVLGLSLLMTAAAIFNIIAVSIPFIPMDVAADKGLWKNRYWLLKAMPMDGARVFNIQSVMLFVPGYMISLAGILCYYAAGGLGIPAVLLSALALCVILYGSSALNASSELLTLTGFFEKHGFIGNLLTLVLPVLYGVLSVGVLALYFAREYMRGIPVLSVISGLLSLPAAVILSVLTITATCCISRVVFVKTWERLEL